jgi:methionine-S-sulfoxide reductase
MVKWSAAIYRATNQELDQAGFLQGATSMLTTRTALTVLLVGLSGMAAIQADDTKPESSGAGRVQARQRAGEVRQASAKSSTAQQRCKAETAIFAGGCFWCMEAVFEQLKGVSDVESGYCGGTPTAAFYERVHSGGTRHAEAIRVTYDPEEISYDQLLDVFFDAHDPTQRNRQGDVDIGRQYRSAIFFATSEQKKQAEAKIADLQKSKSFKKRIVTRLESLKGFYPAEDVHQDFAAKYPFDSYIQEHAIPRVCEVRISHPELIKKGK